MNESLDLTKQKLARMRADIFTLGVNAEHDFQARQKSLNAVLRDLGDALLHRLEERLPFCMDNFANGGTGIDFFRACQIRWR